MVKIVSWILCMFMLKHVAGDIEQRLNILEQRVRAQTLQLAFWEQDYADFKTIVTNTLASVSHLAGKEGDDSRQHKAAVTDEATSNCSSQKELEEYEGKLIQLLRGFASEKQHMHKVADNLSEKFEQLVNTVHEKTSDFEDKISKLQFDVGNLVSGKARYDRGLNDIEIIQSHLKTVNQSILETNIDVYRTKATVTTINEELKILKSSVDKERTRTVNNINQISADIANSQVAFSARTSKIYENLEPWQTIVFGRIITNKGNCYSKDTGIFTAPIQGMYVFFVHILGSKKSNEISVKKNNDTVVWLFSSSSSSTHGNDANMVVVELDKGDEIKVVKHGPYGQEPFYVHHVWSTFSGYMLFSTK